MINILSNADRRTLVLLDEAGAGTDPLEGAAIARAVIEDLLEKGAVVLATTHHTSLKVFAHENDLIENASMEFDSERFRPTYRLIQGIPGASHAFEIASKLGIEERLICRAKDYCGGATVEFEDLTRELLEKMKRLEDRQTTVEASREEVERLRAEHEKKLAEVREHDRELKKQALKEARSIVEDARRTARRFLKDLKASRADAEETRRIESEINAANRRGLKRRPSSSKRPALLCRDPRGPEGVRETPRQRGRHHIAARFEGEGGGARGLAPRRDQR